MSMRYGLAGAAACAKAANRSALTVAANPTDAMTLVKKLRRSSSLMNRLLEFNSVVFGHADVAPEQIAMVAPRRRRLAHRVRVAAERRQKPRGEVRELGRGSEERVADPAGPTRPRAGR